jgi:hypothetical protein
MAQSLLRPAPSVFLLYIQNIKSRGEMRHGFELYISHRINHLPEKLHLYPLDNFSTVSVVAENLVVIRFEVAALTDSTTDVIPQERVKRSGGTLRDPDIGCTDARSAGAAGSTGIPGHAIKSGGGRRVPRPSPRSG